MFQPAVARLPAVIGLALVVAPLYDSSAIGPPQAAPSRAVIDVVVTGRSMPPLGPQDFVVTVEGRPRRVLDVRSVSRGPGATSVASAGSMRRAGDGPLVFAAETSRTVLVAVEQAMLRRGDERRAALTVSALLDRLGLEDRVAIVRLPISSTTPVAFTTDRPAAREAVRRIAGLRPAAGAFPAKPAIDADRSVTEPDRVAGGDPERPVSRAEAAEAADASSALPEDDEQRAAISLGGLAGLLESLRTVPGRKVVALVSGRLPASSPAVNARLDALAGAAAAARTVVYSLGLRSVEVDERSANDFSMVEALAARTGGLFAMIEKDPNAAVERVVSDISGCYVLGIETLPSDADGTARALKVQAARKDLAVRAASLFVARDDPDDLVVTAAGETAAPENRPAGGSDAAREADLQLGVSRLVEYVAAYEREFSAVVAEESYVQTIPGGERKLRSDFLLVRPENSDAWISFRDVFEVDGKPVRDRDERLKHLFLENPVTDALAQLKAIQDESARYNTGRVLRNVNVPLWALRVVHGGNRPRFHFTLRESGQSQGVPTQRIAFEERVRPTLIVNLDTRTDVPSKGWFLVDALTGAILESRLEAEGVDLKATFVVRYRRDAGLGLWVPSEMTEDYTMLERPANRIPFWSIPVQGRANYSNFRRFQVKTEEKITIPK